jgi:hypothetical protein
MVKHSAHDAWDVTQKIQLGANRVKEANAERLRWEFGNITFKPGETVEEFSLRLTTVVSQLWVLGDDITDKDVIKKLLHVIPDKLEQVAISMETLLDLDALSIEEVVDHLRTVERRKKPPSSKDSDGPLLLMEEEWMARMKARDGSNSSFGNHATNNSSGSGKTGAKAKSGNNQNTGGDRKGVAGCEDVFAYCGKKSHWAPWVS